MSELFPKETIVSRFRFKHSVYNNNNNNISACRYGIQSVVCIYMKSMWKCPTTNHNWLLTTKIIHANREIGLSKNIIIIRFKHNNNTYTKLYIIYKNKIIC